MGNAYLGNFAGGAAVLLCRPIPGGGMMSVDEAAGGRWCRLLPLAITRVDAHCGCVGAITDDGAWVRPEPVMIGDVVAGDSPYRYARWTDALLAPSKAANPRPEDRALIAADRSPAPGPRLPRTEWLPFMVRYLDADVASAFAGQRSLGLVEIAARRLYVGCSTAGRRFVRVEFSDAAGAIYDWIVPDLRFTAGFWALIQSGTSEDDTSSRLLARLTAERTFFAIGLTTPNDRFPGKFRGCHPLVVGVHCAADATLGRP